MNTDSVIMLRRNFKHTVRNPTAVFNAVLLPVVIMLMFVYVIGGAFNVGASYIDYATPGMIVLAICYGLSATALAVNSDMTAQYGTAGYIHHLEPVDDPLRHVGVHGQHGRAQPVADRQHDHARRRVIDVLDSDIEGAADHVDEHQHEHDREQDRVEHRDRVPDGVFEVAAQHDHRVAHRAFTFVLVRPVRARKTSSRSGVWTENSSTSMECASS